jgi:hypothetical protein
MSIRVNNIALFVNESDISDFNSKREFLKRIRSKLPKRKFELFHNLEEVGNRITEHQRPSDPSKVELVMATVSTIKNVDQVFTLASLSIYPLPSKVIQAIPLTTEGFITETRATIQHIQNHRKKYRSYHENIKRR